MLFEQPFTKDNLDNYLKKLAKEFRKINGKNMPADIILIGGASVLIQFQEDYPDVTNTDNVNDILAAIKKKKDNK